MDIKFSNGSESDGPFYLTNTGSWSLFTAWVKSLPPDSSFVLRELIDNGTYEGTDLVSLELGDALSQFPPENKTALTVGGIIEDWTGIGDPGETVTLEL